MKTWSNRMKKDSFLPELTSTKMRSLKGKNLFKYKILMDNSVILLFYPRSDLVEIGEAFAKTGIPLVVLSFSLTYWTYGLLKYSDMY